MKKNSNFVEIILAKKNTQIKFVLPYKKGSNIASLFLENSDILKEYINIEKYGINIGVFGKKRSLEYIIRNGDRLEIYRNLLFDPIIRRKNIVREVIYN